MRIIIIILAILFGAVSEGSAQSYCVTTGANTTCPGPDFPGTSPDLTNHATQPVDTPFLAQGKQPGIPFVLSYTVGDIPLVTAAGYKALGAFSSGYLICAISVYSSVLCNGAYHVTPSQTVGSSGSPIALTITVGSTPYVMQGYITAGVMYFTSGSLPSPTTSGMIGATVTGPGVSGGTIITSSIGVASAHSIIDSQPTNSYWYIDEPGMHYGTTTATANWSSGVTSFPVANCGIYAVAGNEALDGTSVIGTISGCASNILTVTPALVGGSNGDVITVADMTPCCDLAHLYSVPAVAAGVNILANYAHSAYPWMKLGISIDGNGVSYKALMDAAIAAGVPMNIDLFLSELYELSGGNSPWTTMHTAYPNVLRMDYAESLMTFCGFTQMDPGAGNDDVVRFWDSDNYMSVGYPILEPENLQYIQRFGALGFNKAALCGMSYSRDSSATTSLIGAGMATRTINDSAPAPSKFPALYAISSCDYRVFSGPNSVVGLNTLNGTDYIPPGWTKTRDWTTRTCGGGLTITLPSSPPPPGTNGAYTGSDGDCRDEIVFPLTGYVSNDILNVVSVTAPGKLAYYQGISGTDGGGNSVSAGTSIVYSDGMGAPAGTEGVYLVNNSQTVGSFASSVSLTVGGNSVLGFIEPTGGGQTALVVEFFGSTFTSKIIVGSSVTGPGVSGGTSVTGLGGTGAAGVYHLSQIQSHTVGSSISPANLSAGLGTRTCYVQVRAHDSSPSGSQYPGSPSGLGWSTFHSFNVFF